MAQVIRQSNTQHINHHLQLLITHHTEHHQTKQTKTPFTTTQTRLHSDAPAPPHPQPDTRMTLHNPYPNTYLWPIWRAAPTGWAHLSVAGSWHLAPRTTWQSNVGWRGARTQTKTTYFRTRNWSNSTLRFGNFDCRTVARIFEICCMQIFRL